MVIEVIKTKFEQGKFQELLDYLTQIEHQETYSSLPEYEQITSLYYKCSSLGRLGKYNEAFQIANEAYNSKSSTDNRIILLILSIAQFNALFHMGDQNKVKNTIKLADSIYETLTFEEQAEAKNWIALYLDIKSRFFLVKGDLDAALHHGHRSLIIKKELGDLLEIGVTMNNLGIYYINKGEVNTALDYFQRSLRYSEQIGSHHEIVFVLTNIGCIHQVKGELEIALDYFKRALAINEEIGNPKYIALTLHNIALAYHHKRELETSLQYFQKSLKLKNTLKNDQSTSITLLSLINLLLDLNELDQAQIYFEQLEQLNNRQNSKIVNQRTSLAHALLLNSSSRIRDKTQAEEIFNQITKEPILHYELTVLAHLYLCKFYLEELQTTGNKEALNELKDHLDVLTQLAKDQNLHSLLAETFLIQAKLKLLDLNLIEAHNLLAQAHNIAAEKGFWNLAVNISNNQDKLFNQADEWNSFTQKSVGSSKIVGLSALNNLFQQMITKAPLKDDQTSQESPVSFHILDSDWFLLFSKSFISYINPEMMNAFLKTIINFTILNRTDLTPIKQIRVQNHQILITSHQGLTFAYIFQGSSFLAIQKMFTLMEFLQTSPPLIQEIFKFGNGSKVPFKRILSQILDELFLNLDNNSITILTEDSTNQEIVTNDKIEFNNLGALLDYSSLWHPIKLMILKLLNHHRRLPATDLSKALGVNRGRMDFHIRNLLKNEYIETRNEFVQTKPLITYHITHKGIQEYCELVQLLQNFHYTNYSQNKEIDIDETRIKSKGIIRKPLFISEQAFQEKDQKTSDQKDLLNQRILENNIKESQKVSLFGLRTPWRNVLEVLAQLPKSGSIRKLAQETNYNKNTILRWIKLAIENTPFVYNCFLNDLQLSLTQTEEIWSYIKKTKTYRTFFTTKHQSL